MRPFSYLIAAALAATLPAGAEEVIEGTISITADRTPPAPTSIQKAPKPAARSHTRSQSQRQHTSTRNTTPPASVTSHTIIRAKEIRDHGYRDINEALASQSGFSFYRSGERGTASGLFLRGAGSENLLVLLDGVPLTDYSNPSAAAMLDAIDITSVERIEILKGPQSGIWGSNALAGVVNIITRSATRYNGGSVGIASGSYGTKAFDFSANRSGQKGHIGISGHRYDTDGFSAKLPRDSETDKASFNDWHLHATLNDGPYGHLDAFAHHTTSDYDYDATDANDTLAHGTSRTTLLGGGYHYNSNRFFVDSQMSLTVIERHSQDIQGNFDANSEALRASLSGGYRGKTQQFMVGFDYARISADTLSGSAWGTFPTHGSFTDKAFFLHYQKTFENFLGARTTIDRVFRYDFFDRFDNKGTYRTTLRRDCNALPGLHTSVSLSSGYKAPSLYALSKATSPLKPTYAHGYEMGIGYKTWLEASYFHTTTEDRIVYTGNAFLPTNSPKEDTISGVELSSRFTLKNTGIRLGANVTHLFSLEDADGNPLIRRAKNSANIFADYAFLTRFRIGAALHYVGERYDTVFDPVTFAGKQVTLPAYTTLDLNFGARLGNGLDLSFHIQNALDKHYETVKGYNTGGRRMTARLKYRF